MKFKTNKIIALIALMGLGVVLTSGTEGTLSDDGKAGSTGSPGETTCVSCHNSYALNSGGGSVSLACNMPSWQYTPGTTYSMSVTVARAGNGLFGFGIEALTAAGQNAGTFVITNAAKTQIKSATVNNVSRKNVVHQKNAGIGTGSYTFDFDWTAPMTNVGTVSFYFAGNAANGNGGTTNDYVYSGLQTATPSATSIGEVSSNSNIEMLYSGINNTLNISGLKEASTVTIMDINGNIQLIRKVKIDEAIELPQLTNGTYIVTVTGEQQSTRQKFMIMN